MSRRPSIEELLQRSIDGELSDAEAERLDRHLAAHPEDAAALEKMRRQSGLIHASIPVPPAAHLRALRDAAGGGRGPGWRIAASVALFAAGLGLGTALPSWKSDAPSDLAVFASQASAAHSLYVSEVLHPVEVAASDKDHLQTWLSNRLGAPIIAPHLGQSGYHLIGGRLLPAGDKPSALFMYENKNGDRVSLLATHVGAAKSQGFRFEKENGYLVVYWQDGPWQYSLVGPEKREPMGEIARLIRGQLT